MRSLLLIFLFVISATTASAECFPISRIMDHSVRDNFQNLCTAAVRCDPICKDIDESKLINCSGTQESNGLLNTDSMGTKLLGCARAFFVDSLTDLADTIIELIKTLVGSTIDSVTDIVRFMTDSEFRAQSLNKKSQMSSLAISFLESSARNFGTEYSRNFRSAVDRVGILQAPMAALGETLLKPFMTMVTDLVTQVTQSYLGQYNCLNSDAKLEAICAMAGGIIMPPAVLFTLLKTGIKGFKAIAGSSGVLLNIRRTFAAKTKALPPKLEATSQATSGSIEKAQDRALPNLEAREAELKRVGALEDGPRLAEAESALGRALTAEEKKSYFGCSLHRAKRY